jgi:protein TonB
VGGVLGGVVGGVLGGVLGGDGDAPIVDLPFSQAKLLKQVRPNYPAIAKKAGVSGVVIVEAIIAVDGKVMDVKVLRSVPLLDQAAIDAVKQWEFEPAVQGGQAVRMRLTVTVQFNIER